ncbi:MAG: mechanosensitive ion channel family protein [Ignavibacteriales bacterium]|nr:mechanosensitive ion channel family protein [Ignavibacteriales bacterium]
MNNILDNKYWGNTLQDYVIAVSIILITIIASQVIKRIILTRIQKNGSEENKNRTKFISKSINRFVIPALYFGAVYAALEFLSFGKSSNKIITIVYSVLLTFFIIRFLIAALNHFLSKYFEEKRGEEDGHRLKPLISFLNFFVWIIGLLFLLDNLGFQISTIVAGLGISGIAVALAAQAILGDLFSYFVIFFDRPVEIGDFITFDSKEGTIEKIGIKTTRVRALSGEQLIVANSKLTSSILHNYKRLETRRIVFKLGVTYQTKSDQLKMIPGIVKGIIEKHEQIRFDRAHFKSYGDFSLNFEIVYYVLSSDYTFYMDIQEKINLEIYDQFEKLGIKFAYPTQTLYLNTQK